MDFRIGTVDDTTTFALLFDAAGRRIPSYFWSQYAADGQSFFEFGRERIRTDTEIKSYYKNWHVFINKCNRTVLHFCCWIAFCMNIGNLLKF